MPRGTHSNHARAGRHVRWSGERKIIASTGYVKVRVGRDHPLADPNGYAYEHLVVWCSAGHPRPSKGFVLHHRNEVKSDNRIENLEITSRVKHSTNHHATLTDEEVRKIRIAYAEGAANMPILAQQFRISVKRISKMIQGKTRRDAGGPISAGDKRRTGKKAAGAMLDGREWREMPA